MGVPAEQPGSDEADLTKDLFDEYRRMVLVLCLALLRNHAEAEDAAQQTFLAAYRSILAGHRPRNPAAWLATIARNECRSRWANRGDLPLPLTDVEGADLDPAEIAAAHEELSALTRAFAELPERQRAVVRLHCLAGLSYGEVAETLAISSRAVDGLLVRARKQLRRRMRGRRTGVLVVPGFLRDRLAQLAGAGEASGAAAVAAGGGAGAFTAAGSPSLTAKLAVVGVGIATLGAAADQTPEPRRNLAKHGAHQIRQKAPAQPGRSLLPVRLLTAEPRPERTGRFEDDDRDVDSRGRGSGRLGSGSGEGSSSGPGEGGSESGSRGSGPGGSGSGGSSSGSSGSGSSGSAGSGSEPSSSGSSGSGGSGSENSGSVSSGSGSSGSGSSGSGSG